MDLEVKIDEIRELFGKTLFELNRMTFDHYKSNLNRAKSNMKQIYELRDYLKANYPLEELQEYNKELLVWSKQIKKKYDNIFESVKDEKNKLEGQLKSVQNKKKIANYSR